MQSVRRSNIHPEPSRPENRNMNAKTTRTAALTVTLPLASVAHHAMYTPQALWTMAREKADVTLVVLKNDSYGILNIELARVREGDPNEKMLSMLRIDNPSLD